MSLGLVQHHFATKAGLIKAVDDYVLSVVIAVVAQPIAAPPTDSIAEMGSRVTQLIIEHPDVVDYFGRALIDGSPLGVTIFDTLAAFGTARWNTAQRERGNAPDIDLTWAALNSLVLGSGHPDPARPYRAAAAGAFSAPAQLERWQDSVNTLLRDGLFRPRRRDRLVSPTQTRSPQPFCGRWWASPRRTG